METYTVANAVRCINGARGFGPKTTGPVLERTNFQHAETNARNMKFAGEWKLPEATAKDIQLSQLLVGVKHPPPLGKGEGRLTIILRNVHLFPAGTTLMSVMAFVEGSSVLDEASIKEFARQLEDGGD